MSNGQVPRTRVASLVLVALLVFAVTVACQTLLGSSAPARLMSRYLQVSSGRLAGMSPQPAAPDCALNTPAHSVSARFADGLRLVGYEMDTSVLAARLLVVKLYWSADGSPGKNYRAFVRVLGPDGKAVIQHEAEPAGGASPNSKWGSDAVVQDPHLIVLSAYHPPGWYDLEVGMYSDEKGTALPVVEGVINRGSQGVILPERLQVLPALPPPKVTSH